MSLLDISETIEKNLKIVDRWKQTYGEEIARELIRAYLDGVDDALKTLQTLGAGATSALFDRLRGD